MPIDDRMPIFTPDDIMAGSVRPGELFYTKERQDVATPLRRARKQRRCGDDNPLMPHRVRESLLNLHDLSGYSD